MENAQVSSYSDGQGWAPCRTVGSAYVGSNPTPATSKTPGQALRGVIILHRLMVLSAESRGGSLKPDGAAFGQVRAMESHHGGDLPGFLFCLPWLRGG
jgi:hypothetical protein